MSDQLRYPIGKFQPPDSASAADRAQWIDRIRATPGRLAAAVEGLSEEQIDTPYREDGWTIRQVVHHVPDSHMNSYVRFKLALTETSPAIKGYNEAAWAKLADTERTPVKTSLCLLDCLHKRWVVLLENMTDADFERTLQHPQMGEVKLSKMLALYAWHGDHHVEHVLQLRQRRGW